MKYDLITISLVKSFGKKKFHIKATQEYLAEFDIGHYKFVIFNEDEKNGGESHILKVSSSCCAAPHGKIDTDFLNMEMKRFNVEYEQSQACLKKASG